MGKKRKKQAPAKSRVSSLLQRPWLFAGAVLGLDIAMLVMGMVLSGISFEVTYSLNDIGVERSQPLAFFGVIAAVVLGLDCVLAAFIIAGSFLKKRRAAQIAGASALLVLSVIMIGGSAFMALGLPPKSRQYFNFNDTEYRLIIEEDEYYSGKGKLTLFLTDAAGKTGQVGYLASTDLRESSTSAERFEIEWKSDDVLEVGFVDGGSYRTLSMNIDRSKYPLAKSDTASE